MDLRGLVDKSWLLNIWSLTAVDSDLARPTSEKII